MDRERSSEQARTVGARRESNVSWRKLLKLRNADGYQKLLQYGLERLRGS